MIICASSSSSSNVVLLCSVDHQSGVIGPDLNMPRPAQTNRPRPSTAHHSDHPPTPIRRPRPSTSHQSRRGAHANVSKSDEDEVNRDKDLGAEAARYKKMRQREAAGFGEDDNGESGGAVGGS
jgi:hypothetical protein